MLSHTPAQPFHPPPQHHGGPDEHGVPAWDLSTNTNAYGPYPAAQQAVREADARHYPDPAYTQLCVQLAAWHGVAPARIVLAASGSEFIQRMSLAVALQAGAGQGAGQGAPRVWLPRHAYGDYTRAAQAAGLACGSEPEQVAQAALLWACEPSSPLGQADADLPRHLAALRPGQSLVLDQAYEPLRLAGSPSLQGAALDAVWRLITPNKALGLTGVRAAYAIAPLQAPAGLLARLRALAPSWPVGAHGVALLQTWASAPAHEWLADARQRLGACKAQQTAALQAAGWQVAPSDANFFVATPPAALPLPETLRALRQRGIKLRDCTSFGLPGRVRMAVTTPEGQAALMAALMAALADVGARA